MTTSTDLLRLFTHSAPSGLRPRECFTTVVEMIAIGIRNAVHRREPHWQEREQRYLDHIQRFPGLVDLCPKVLAYTAQALTDQPSDVLGEIYMQLGASREMGQFFTPYEISRLCAELTIHGHVDELRELPFIKIHEPAFMCKSGVSRDTKQAAA